MRSTPRRRRRRLASPLPRPLPALRALLLGAVAALATALSACAPIGAHRVIERTRAAAGPPAVTQWDQVFAHPVPVRLTAFVTGWVEAGPEILIEARDARVPASARRRLWVPSIAYLLEHPTRGAVLLDAGVRAGDCAYGLRPFYWVPCRSHPGADVVAQLRARGIDPRAVPHVVISHFHGDHASGLDALLRAGAPPRVVTTRAELAALESPLRETSGYPSAFFARPFVAELVDRQLVAMPIVERAADFFGDGSLWLLPTAGHTRGHLAAVVNARPAPLLLTFDVAHLGVGFELGVPPGARADDREARASLARLRALARAYPALRVIYGHEPSQWRGRGDAVVLATGEASP